MVPSATGFLCLNCGEVVTKTPAKQDPAQTPKPHEPQSDEAAEPTKPVSEVTDHDTVPSNEPRAMPVADHKTTDEPIKRSKKPLFMIVIVMLLVLAGGASAYYYAEVIQSKQAPMAYLTKLLNAKRGQFAATGSFKSSNPNYSSYTVNIRANGQYDTSDMNNPKVSAKLDGSIGTGSVSVDLMTLDKAVYFKIGSFSLLSTLGLKVSNEWYKASLDDASIKTKCQTSSSKSSGTFLGIQLPSDFPVSNAKRVGLWETVAGHQTTHYTGTLDKAKLQQYIDHANQDLSADCKISYNSSDYQTLTVSYDLWTSKDFDRLNITTDDSKTKSHVAIGIDTHDYNKSVSITPPANPKSVNDLLKPTAH